MTTRLEPARQGGVRAVDRVRANLSQMSTAMTKIAELIFEQPSAPLDLSITELAERAGTSAATVTRFCRVVGYSGYVQFRVALAADLGRAQAHETWGVDIGRQFAPEDSVRDVLHTLLTNHTRSLEATAALIDLAQVADVARAVWECDHLDIYGIGGSAVVATELQTRLYRIGVNAHAWGEPHSGLASAAFQGPGDVAIAISNSGRTEEIIDMLGQASSSGAMTVAITSNRDSPLGRVADITIVNASPEPYLQPSELSAKPAQLLVLDLLYLLVAQQDFEATATRLSATRMAVSGHRRPLSPTRRPARSAL